MTWHRFWLAGEQASDRFITISLTLGVLKLGGYLTLPWIPVFVCMLAAFVGGVLFGTIAAASAPVKARDQW